MNVVRSIKNLFHPKKPTAPPPAPLLRSQKQANGRNFDGPAGSPYRVKKPANYGVIPSRIAKPNVGRQFASKIPAARVFNATNDDNAYLVPRGRAAASHVGAANGATDNGRFLSGRKIKESISIPLANAQTDFKINIAGNGVIYADSTNASDRVSIRFGTSDGDQSGPLVPFRPGQTIAGERFSVLYVTNGAIAAATATLLICDDSPSDPLVIR